MAPRAGIRVILPTVGAGTAGAGQPRDVAQICPTASDQRVILVVNQHAAAARLIGELIEFMDTPRVCTAAPEDWRQRLGDGRLEALFVGPDLDAAEVHELIEEVGQSDPNVPIVLLYRGGAE